MNAVYDKMPSLLRQLKTDSPDFSAQLDALLDRDQVFDTHVEKTVREIIGKVRQYGDQALLDLTAQYDGLRCKEPADLEIDPSECENALSRIDVGLRRSLEHAADRIRQFHTRQRETSWHYEQEDGTRLGQQIRPLERVGIYVPGGTASYPSSVLMNSVPARVAGVDEIVMTVPASGGQCSDAVLAASRVAGVDRVFQIGGAQAVAAMAYGTGTVPRVDKIVGPGNRFVAEAKRQVFGQVGIDMIAGPSEVVVICDDSADPDWVAIDLMAQAEHDKQAQSILICPDSRQIERVRLAVNRLLPQLDRHSVITASLQARGAVILVDSLYEAIAIANRIAPEHLQLMVDEPEELLARVRHAGAVFCGHYSAESLGDYCVGPNHVLPTAGTARFSSPLGVYDFQTRSSVIRCSAQGAADLSETAITIAASEGLTAHAQSAAFRNRPPAKD